MDDASDYENRIKIIENRQKINFKQLEEFRKIIEHLPSPKFLSFIEQNTFDSCIRLKIKEYRFRLLKNTNEKSFDLKRAPHDYYEWSLEQRKYFYCFLMQF